jgi:hypothetical protein
LRIGVDQPVLPGGRTLGNRPRHRARPLIDGQRDPKVLAQMAHGSMRRKIPQLREALTGHFDDHHAFICATMLRRIDTLAADIAVLDTRIAELIAPFALVVEKAG